MTCPNYVADPSYQIGAGSTGPFDCTAHSFSDAIDASTCGRKDPGGRTIRLLSNEPIPDKASPGLNLEQGADVALDQYGVYFDVRKGYRKVTWAEYERRRLDGQPTVIQVNYGPIADSRYDAGRGFRGGHAMAETGHATYDPLADGRAPGVFKFNGTVYDRALMRKAAGQLVIGSAGPGPLRVGDGWVWAAFGRDVVPDYLLRIPAGSYFAYQVKGNSVVMRRARRTGGFSAKCSAPRSYRWGTRRVTLVRILSGAHTGQYVSAKYSREAP